MKTLIGKLSLLVGVCALAACSTVTVSTDYDHSAPFAKYKTYALAPATHGQVLSATSEAALRNALRTDLAAKGLTEATNGKPDLAVVRHVFLKDKVAVQQYTDWGYGYRGAWPYGYGYYNMWYGAPRTYVDVQQYTQGTMILDFVDVKTKKLVFRGRGEAIVGDAASNAEKIREGVKKMVEAYPGTAAH
jgi:hypothetical protein